jgi:Protein of unknown function (DUF1616)
VVRARTDLWLVAALAVAAALLVALLPGSLVELRAPAALALVLALPGYALAAAIFPPAQLRAAERLALSIAISVAATIAAALLLAVLGVGLTTAPWMALLAAFALAGAAGAGARGHAQVLARPSIGLRGREIGALAGAVVLLGGAAALGLTPLGAPRGTQGTTSLWICSKSNGCDLPAGTVKVGVISDQLHAASYTVQVSVAGRPGIRFGPVTLAPGATWSRVMTTGHGEPVVRAVLRTTANPSGVYRTVILRYKRTRNG